VASPYYLYIEKLNKEIVTAVRWIKKIYSCIKNAGETRSSAKIVGDRGVENRIHVQNTPIKAAS